MKIHVGLQNHPRGLRHPVLAIGTFDGVHLGHQQVLRLSRELARSCGGTTVAVTFYPHPLRVLNPEHAPAMLQTFGQRCATLQSLGVDVLWVIPFTWEMAQLSHRQFAEEILCRQVKAQHICIGRNFHFGFGRKGNPAYLRQLGMTEGFSVQEVAEVLYRNLPVRSTGIRRLLLHGRVRLAAKLLGRPPSLVGSVVHGNGFGARLGFPTANMIPENELLPQNGVYLTIVVRQGKQYPGVTNIGVRPTMEQASASRMVHLETHLLEFSGDLYGEDIELYLLARLRQERKFENPEALRHQIARDCRRARRFFDKQTESYANITGTFDFTFNPAS